MAENGSQTSSHGLSEGDGDKIKVPEIENDECFSVHPNIPETFIGKSVLVTGATGFLGKVLVEKLLRSCPGIKEVLILVRPSKKGSVESRLRDYKDNHIFNRIRDEAPKALDKLKALTGDIVLDNAGLCPSELQKVITEVSFIFHSAANVRFDDEARETLGVNLVGVKNVLDVCKACHILEAFVHVSTAYSFCNNSVISEQLYPEYVRPHNIIEVTKWMTNSQLKTLCMHYVQGRPSLYPFSKAMAETFLIESKQNVPVIIVRPSIVTASAEDPYPGWIDNYNGPSGFINVCGKGIVKTLLADPRVNADWIPVDIVVNTLIAAAHYLSVQRKSKNPPMKLRATDGVPIVNCVCSDKNAITWMKIAKIIVPIMEKYPSTEVYNKPGGTVTSSAILYFICRLTYHYIPAVLIDAVSLLLFRKPRMITLYRRIHGVIGHLEYYTTRSFTFHSRNMQKLIDHMDPDDRKVFPIDQSMLNWDKYLENYVLGVRRYFSREADETLPDARRRLKKFTYLWLTLKLSSIFGMLTLLKFLYRRGSLKTILVTSVSVFAMIATRVQNAKLQAEMKLKPPRNF